MKKEKPDLQDQFGKELFALCGKYSKKGLNDIKINNELVCALATGLIIILKNHNIKKDIRTKAVNFVCKHLKETYDMLWEAENNEPKTN